VTEGRKKGRVLGRPWLATQGHVVALSPLPPLGWGGEWKENGKTYGSG